jgi:hypothetical protein
LSMLGVGSWEHADRGGSTCPGAPVRVPVLDRGRAPISVPDSPPERAPHAQVDIVT